MSPKRSDLTWWQILGSGLAAGLLAFGGGSGIAATINAIQGPDLPREACTTYWAEVHELKAEGFTGFSLMDEGTELSQRCGYPEDVANAWVEENSDKP